MQITNTTTKIIWSKLCGLEHSGFHSYNMLYTHQILIRVYMRSREQQRLVSQPLPGGYERSAYSNMTVQYNQQIDL